MKTKFVRVGRSGPTVDGRSIPAGMIDQAAAAYDPAVYQARINVEHFRGLLPDGPFRMYGDVTALKAEADGEERVLLAELDITEDLAGLLAKRQKTHWSMELSPNFAGTGGAYLVGLAVTDNPASLATEALKFAATPANPMLFGAVFEAGALEAARDGPTLPAPKGARETTDPPAAERPFLGQLSALLTGPARRREDRSEKRAEDRFGALELAAMRLAEDAASRSGEMAALAGRFETLAGIVEKIGAAQDALTENLSHEPAAQARQRIAGGAETQTDI